MAEPWKWIYSADVAQWVLVGPFSVTAMHPACDGDLHRDAFTMAAAPAMLDALCDLIDPDAIDRHPQDYMPVWHRARAAVSLAQFGWSAGEGSAGKPMAPIEDHEIPLVIALGRVLEAHGIMLSAQPAIVVNLLDVIRHYGAENSGKDQAG